MGETKRRFGGRHRAALVVALSAVLGCRSEASASAQALREGLRPGMSVEQVLETMHQVHAAHREAWTFATVWGTPVPLGHLAIHDAARMEPGIEGLTWGSQVPTAEGRREAAKRLQGARQLWFTMRGFGYLHLEVTLDGAGRVLAVSEVSGHAS